ncbi:solute carrier family 2, facilitated glucose transporter member 12 [Trichonephila clavipes]|nr:solute carrier family 2, facilitated glucose transporter member 12 [Trichonephila clavipes]
MMVSLNEVGITVGFLLAYLINYTFITTSHGWRYMFGAAVILAVIQGIGVTFMPNSHHYLLVKGETDKVNDTSISLITSSFQHSTRTYHFNKIMYRTIVL